MSYLAVGNNPALDILEGKSVDEALGRRDKTPWYEGYETSGGSKPPPAQQSKFAGIGLVAGVAVAVVATYFLFWSSKEK